MRELSQENPPLMWRLDKITGFAWSGLFVLIPVLASLGIAAVFYPGFMTYDTIHALRSARVGVTDSMWPPMVSYVWRFVNLISFNPSAMHFSQVLLLLSSIFCIVYFFTKRIIYATLFLVAYLSLPVILGSVAAIWKDVLMAAFFLAGFAIIIFLPKAANKWTFNFSLLAAFFLIFLGICTRHNAIAGAVPLLFYLSFILCKRFLKTFKGLWLSTVFIGTALILGSFIIKVQLDNYSLPSFQKLNNISSYFIKSTWPYDIAGASICVGRNLFEDIKPGWPLSKIKEEYNPRHQSLAGPTILNMMWTDKIEKVWLNVLIQHPFCFFYHKWQLTKYLLGVNKGPQFLITVAAIENNEYGYNLPPSEIRDKVVYYIISSAKLFFVKPWFYYCLAIVIFIGLAFRRLLTLDYMVIVSSGMLYLISLIIFGNAADARLPFYSTTIVLIFLFSAFIKYVKSFSR